MKHPLPLAVRVLAILASICFVASFALALLLPASLTLASLIARANHMALVHMQNAVRGTLGDWAWVGVVVPVLARPDWLAPLGLGLVLAGVAVSLATHQPRARSRTRRP